MPALETDLDLLRRFIDANDAEAFGSLVQRHTSLVYYTCLRVLGDRERAEDAAQETFHRLMRHPEKVNHSVSAWLHRVATRLSIDVLRSDAARRRRELSYQDRLDRRREPAEPWSDVSEQIDAALARLNYAERQLLVEHFLNGKTQAELARETGVSKATMCRRMDAAMKALRKHLGRGATLSVAALAGLLSKPASAAVPATLAHELNKMTLISGTTTGTAAIGTTIGVGGVSLKAWPLAIASGFAGAAAMGLIVLAVLSLNQTSLRNTGPHRTTEAIEAAVSNETQDTLSNTEAIYLREPGESLRSDHVLAYTVEGDLITIVYADSHIRTMPRSEARPIIESQAGQTLEQLAARASQP